MSKRSASPQCNNIETIYNIQTRIELIKQIHMTAHILGMYTIVVHVCTMHKLHTKYFSIHACFTCAKLHASSLAFPNDPSTMAINQLKQSESKRHKVE